MEKKKSREESERKSKSNSSAFIAYAIVVFSALAVGLIVILVRSGS